MCVCFCEFKGMLTCLSQTTWGKKEGRAKGAKLGLSFSLFMSLSLSLSRLQIVTRSTENILRDFLPFKTKSRSPPPPFPYHSPRQHVKVGTVQQLSMSADVHFPGQGRKKAPEPS